MHSVTSFLNLQELDGRDQQNSFIPKWVYTARREHYIYWEHARLAKGYPRTFTHSNWDEKQRIMYHVDIEGNMQYFKEEGSAEDKIFHSIGSVLTGNYLLLENPLLSWYIRRKDEVF